VTDELRQLLRVGMTFNTPMSEARAAALVEALAPSAQGATVLDLGCGWGELMLRIVAAAPGARGLGLDLDPPSLARGRRLADERGLADRVRFEAADVTHTEARGRLVVSIGVSWAWGPASAALAALARAVEPGGSLCTATRIGIRPRRRQRTRSSATCPPSTGWSRPSGARASRPRAPNRPASTSGMPSRPRASWASTRRRARRRRRSRSPAAANTPPTAAPSASHT